MVLKLFKGFDFYTSVVPNKSQLLNTSKPIIRVMATVSEMYRHLEFVEGERVPYIRGTRISAGGLGCDFRNQGWGYKSLEHLAEDRGLSLEAVKEAIEWYDANKELVTSEFARSRKKCGLKS